MSTKFLFREQPYRREAGAIVTALHSDGGIELDQTIFYAQSGGQPGDIGILRTEANVLIPITSVIHPEDKTQIIHIPESGDWGLKIGDRIICEIDWEPRFGFMRMHTALHLLSVVFPFPVTGGSIGEEKSRLDFDMPEVPNNLELFEAEINQRIQEDHTVGEEWISEDELAANPEMVKTMKVKPPMGQGRIRLICIATDDLVIDLQPCGGTHVAKTGEIGKVRIGKIQNKGKQNRRVYLHLV